MAWKNASVSCSHVRGGGVRGSGGEGGGLAGRIKTFAAEPQALQR